MQIKLQSSPLSYEKFSKKFIKLNAFKLLGSGFFADVFISKQIPFVYKIAAIDNNLTDKDYKKSGTSMTKHQALQDPYLAFLNKIKDLDNPFFPKVRTLTILKHHHQNFYVVEMEKLNNLSDRVYQKNTKIELDDFNQAMLHRLNLLFDKRYQSNIKQLWEQAKKDYQAYPHAAQVFEIMNELLEDYSNDLHSNNMMKRVSQRPSASKFAQLVITDPLCPKNMQTPENIPVRKFLR